MPGLKKLFPSTRVNFPMVIKVLGWLLIVEGCFMTLPLLASILCNEGPETYAFSIATAITLASGILSTVCIHPARTDMGKREGFLLTAAVWVVFSFFGMLPFIISPNIPMGVTDGFFEAMSGFTTTGASLIPPDMHIPDALHLWRCLSQWIGGMGIILFTLAVLPMLNSSGGMQMFNAEVTGITHDKLRPRISQTAKGLWAVYIILTLLCFACLWSGPMNCFEAGCHAMSTLSTGGFSTSANGIEYWSSTYIKIVLTVFMFLGGVNFSFIFRAATGQFSFLRQSETFMTYLKIIGISLIIFSIVILSTGTATSFVNAVIDPLFQIISIITSTGYTLDAFDSWGPLILSITILLMFIGACAGSTSGGVKVDRILVLVKYLKNELHKCIRPNYVTAVRMNGKPMNMELVNKVVAFLSLYVIIIMCGGVALTIFGVPLFDSFFSAFSCMSNTGLDSVITGYGSTYLHMPDGAKWILAILMLIGRLEVFTVLILISRTFWRK